jgi:hypothetical protein
MSTSIPSSNVTFDSTIVAALVSAIISLIILAVSNYFIQPRKLRHNWKVENLEKRVEAYSALITLFNSMEAKINRQPINLPEDSKDYYFQMENPGDYDRLLSLIETKNYLFSKELTTLWYKTLVYDKMFDMHHTSIKGGLTLMNFKDMQKRAKEEYVRLCIDYQRLTGIIIPS